MKRLLSLFPLLMVLLAFPSLVLADTLLIDSDFEPVNESTEWPEGWPRIPDATLETEEGNTFLRIVSPEPDKMVMLYREINIPEGAEAISFTWKQRVTNLKRGKNSWFDARIMMEFMDAARNKVGPSPPTPNRSKDTDGWEERQVKFNLPEEARILKFMPSLFNVTSGTYDFDDVVMKTIPKLPPEEDPAHQRKLKQEADLAKRRDKASAQLEKYGDCIPNGDMELDSNGDGKPDHWSGATFLTESSNTFMRITAPEPDKVNMYYRKLDLPAGVEAMELSWRWRITDLKPGKEAWFDARIMCKLLNAKGSRASSQIGDPYTRRSTDGWQTRSIQFLVPEDAVSLELMPSLFQVKAGTLDMDDFSLKPTDAEALKAKKAAKAAQAAKMHVDAEAPNKEAWPPELRVKGNRLVDPEGGEVWLQGVNIASLEWNPRGESVMKSAQVVLEEWGANVIRLPVKEQYWFDPKGGEAYKSLIDDVITYTANRGAYVVLDLHRYRAPRQEHLEFWEDAALRYKNHPAVIFDLLNEPHTTSWEVWRNGGFVEDKKAKADEDAFLTAEEKAHNARGFVSVGMQGLMDAVRNVGANNVVLIGGLDWAYDLSGILNGYAIDEHPDGQGIIYATHVYPWKRDWQKSFLDVAAVHPILLGEVGADANKMTWMPEERQEDWQTWVPRMLHCIQENRLNWTAWCFHPKASPRILLDWDYTPTPFWGVFVKEAFAGKKFDPTPIPVE